MKILVTGAAGRIGSSFVTQTQYDFTFRLTDLIAVETSSHEFMPADLCNPEAVDTLVKDMDAIVHLGGRADPKMSFIEVMKTNVEPTHLLLDAAVRHAVKRFIFASSAQVIEGYPVSMQVSSDIPISPANFYAVGKCYGEALCAYYAHAFKIDTVSLRIGAFEQPDNHQNLKTLRDFSAWISPTDTTHLIERALLAKTRGHVIANGISDNRFKRLDISHTQNVIGFHPKDDAFTQFSPNFDQYS